MAVSRSLGGNWLTTRSEIRISPPLMCSRPAIMRSKVDLPQPEGPTRTTNSPSAISTLTSWITYVDPNALRTPRIATDAIVFLLKSPRWRAALVPALPGEAHSDDIEPLLRCHARACRGHPRLSCRRERRGWPGQARP